MKKNILIDDIVYFLLGIYLFCLEFVQDTIVYKLAFILLIIAFTLSLFKNKKISFNIFIISYSLYIIFQFILLFLNIPLSTSLFGVKIHDLIIILFILFMIYNIIVNDGRMSKFMKIFILVNFFVLLSIMIASRNNLFTHRLAHSYAHEHASFYIFGYPIYMTANALAVELAVSFIFSLYFYKTEKRKLYFFLALFFSLGIILTGSRKGCIILLIYIIWWFNEQNKGKYFKKIIVSIIAIIISYVAIMNVPFLYNSIGSRFVDLENYVFHNELTVSVSNRDMVKDLATEKIVKSPIYGYGEGAFKYFFSGITASNSENNYLELLIHGGIIGLFIYYIYFFKLLIKSFRYQRVELFDKIFIVVVFSIHLIEFSSVHYTSLKVLMFIVLFFANNQIKSKKKDVIECE